MEADKVDKFLLAHENKFPEYEIPIHRLLDLVPEKEVLLENTRFKSPGKILTASIFLGMLGLDRFLIGDWGKGGVKLFTCGGLGLWWIADWFIIMEKTRKKNMEKLIKIVLQE